MASQALVVVEPPQRRAPAAGDDRRRARAAPRVGRSRPCRPPGGSRRSARPPPSGSATPCGRRVAAAPRRPSRRPGRWRRRGSTPPPALAPRRRGPGIPGAAVPRRCAEPRRPSACLLRPASIGLDAALRRSSPRSPASLGARLPLLAQTPLLVALRRSSLKFVAALGDPLLEGDRPPLQGPRLLAGLLELRERSVEPGLLVAGVGRVGAQEIERLGPDGLHPRNELAQREVEGLDVEGEPGGIDDVRDRGSVVPQALGDGDADCGADVRLGVAGLLASDEARQLARRPARDPPSGPRRRRGAAGARPWRRARLARR